MVIAMYIKLDLNETFLDSDCNGNTVEVYVGECTIPVQTIASGLNQLGSLDQTEALFELRKWASPTLCAAIREVFK